MRANGYRSADFIDDHPGTPARTTRAGICPTGPQKKDTSSHSRFCLQRVCPAANRANRLQKTIIPVEKLYTADNNIYTKYYKSLNINDKKIWHD